MHRLCIGNLSAPKTIRGRRDAPRLRFHAPLNGSVLLRHWSTQNLRRLGHRLTLLQALLSHMSTVGEGRSRLSQRGSIATCMNAGAEDLILARFHGRETLTERLGKVTLAARPGRGQRHEWQLPL